jgi:SAM-dependent methyltransferase
VNENSATPRLLWEKGLGSEVDFWDEFLRQGGLSWPEELRRRVDPDSPFQPMLASLIQSPPGSRVRVLDVGAGPLTNLGKVLDSYDLEITAVDPLAKTYNALLAKHNVVVPVQTIPCDAETLVSRFGENCFDLVYARNCLDHGYDPACGFRQMLAVVKKGCWVHTAHAVNEGVNGGYNGLHQWNFDLQEGRFIIWNPEVRIDMSGELHSSAEIDAHILEAWIFVSLRKR